MKKLPLTCPCKLKKSLKKIKNSFICLNKKCIHNKPLNAFQFVKSKPILISEQKTDTVCDIKSSKIYVKRSFSKIKFIKKYFFGDSNTTKKNCEKFLSGLLKNPIKPKVLVVGGAEKGSGADKLWLNKKIELHSIDIYASKTVDVICDAHYLPLKKNFYNGVWIQAVLEHVVDPKKVVDEIYRVLKPGGIVYAETPFMQQVHEGAYDFTRYTVLGHRFLFKKFQLIDIGGNKGPEIAFAWSAKYLVWSLTRNQLFAKIIGNLITLLVSPLRFFLSKKSMYDASSGVFFLGRKVKNYLVTHKKLISLYKGQF